MKHRLKVKKGMAMPRKFVLELEFPEDVSEKDLEDVEIKKKSKEVVVLELLRKKKISQGKAAEILGITRDELFDLMAKYDVPLFDVDKEELKRELKQ